MGIYSSWLFWLEENFTIKDDILPEKADVIIGLGTGLSPDGKQLSPQGKAIIEKMAYLVVINKSKNIVFTGGYHLLNNPLIEADAMSHHFNETEKAYKKDGLTLKIQMIDLEIRSWTTYQNADYCAEEIMAKNGWTSAIIVAQQWHARRARATFKKRWRNKGIKFYFVKAYSGFGGNCQKRWNNVFLFLFWDTLAFAYSKIKGYT